MKYQEIIHTIENKKRFGNLPGVVISEKLLAAVGNPQKELAFIHIAGTNGKGSVAAFLRAILSEAQIKTGVFTSPHLIDFTERILADEKQIPKEEAARLGQQLLELKLDIHPTMFDYCLAMALLYFKEQGCSLVVLETGLGGRLDATNVIDAPLVSIITKIGYDHTEVLGETLAEIAAEKAGILKKGTKAVLESQQPEAMQVLKQRCEKLQIPYKIVETSQIVPIDSGFAYPGENPYRMKMLGCFQRENAMAAVLAARELMGLGYPVTEQAVHGGIAKAVWNGRMEILCREPFLMIDGAHNENGAAALAKSLSELYPGQKFHFIMGVLSDKDYKEMARRMIPLAKRVTALTPNSSRALLGEKLAEYIRSFGVEAEHKENLAEVFAPFLSGSSEKNMHERTIAFGSLYFIGDIRKFFQLSISSGGKVIN